MMEVRRSQERGHAVYDWLDTYHTFSFDTYHDPAWTRFRTLRVLNEDRVQGGQGFPMHPHRDMEIITYVLEGGLRHQDSLGNGSVIRPGDGQRMSAGRGILHSEANASESEPVHLLQIWILPEKKGIEPGYEQKVFPREEKQGRLRLIAARDGRQGAVTIHQDADVYASLLEPGQQVGHRLRPGRGAWLQVARGSVSVDGTELQQGDGAAIREQEALTIRGMEPAEILLFDLA